MLYIFDFPGHSGISRQGGGGGGKDVETKKQFSQSFKRLKRNV